MEQGGAVAVDDLAIGLILANQLVGQVKAALEEGPEEDVVLLLGLRFDELGHCQSLVLFSHGGILH